MTSINVLDFLGTSNADFYTNYAEVKMYSYVRTLIFTQSASSLTFNWSADGVNTDYIDSISVLAGVAQSVSHPIRAKFLSIGLDLATPPSVVRLQSFFFSVTQGIHNLDNIGTGAKVYRNVDQRIRTVKSSDNSITISELANEIDLVTNLSVGPTGSTGPVGYTGSTGPTGPSGGSTKIYVTNNDLKVTEAPVGTFTLDVGSSASGTGSIKLTDGTGVNNNGPYTISIGADAGFGTQYHSGIAIGYSAGNLFQGTGSISIGKDSGYFTQSTNCVAIGVESGNSTQNNQAVAVGYRSGRTDQANYSVAIGPDSGYTGQGGQSVSVGNKAGQTRQGSQCVSIGYLAGDSDQGTNGIAIGRLAGQTTQGSNCIAIGNSAGNYLQSNSSIAIGQLAGTTGQATGSISIGNQSGQYNQGNAAVAIGFFSGNTSQGADCVAIGKYASEISQTTQAVSIGYSSGRYYQGNSAVSIGFNSALGVVGDNTKGQKDRAIAIGALAAQVNQGLDAISIGYNSANTDQLANSIALGSGCATPGAVGRLAFGSAMEAVTSISSTSIEKPNGFVNLEWNGVHKRIPVCSNTATDLMANHQPMALGELYYQSSSGTATSGINTAGGIHLAPATTLTTTSNLSSSAYFDESINGRLRYLGATTTTFYCSFSISASVTFNQSLSFWIKKSGVTESKSINYLTSGSANNNFIISAHFIVSLAQNQYLEIWGENTSGSNELTIKNLNLSVIGNGS